MRRKSPFLWLLCIASFLAITLIAGLMHGLLQDSTGGRARSIESPLARAAPPSAPLIPSAISGDSQITINWLPPFSGGPITNYTIFRGTTPSGKTVLTTIGNVMTYTNTGLANGQEYYYVIAAVNADGTGTNSSEVSATPRTVPSAPLNLVALHGNAVVNLSWKVSSSNGGSPIFNYFMYRGQSPGSETFLTPTGNVTSYNDTGVTNGQRYYYQVSAVNIAGEGTNKSNEADSGIVGSPSAPRSLAAVPGNGQIALTWQAPASNGGSPITGYVVYRGTASGNGSSYESIGNVTSYNDTGVINGRRYYYEVAAMNGAGEGYLSNEADALLIGPPAAPLNPTASIGNRRVHLTWQAPSSNGGAAILGYTLFRSQIAGNETFLALAGNVTAYNDTSVTNGVRYYYKVAAVNIFGQGALSSVVNATPMTGPAAPHLLIATAGNAQITLNWQAPSDNGGSPVTGYIVFRGTASGTETYITTIGNLTSFMNTGLTNGQVYYYQVSAMNSAGNSSRSTETGTVPRTIPGVVRSFSAAPGNRTVVLTWQPPASNGGSPVTGYNIYRGTSSGTGAIVAVIGNVTTHADNGLVNGVRYYYKVSAVNIAGEGNVSGEINSTPVTRPGLPLAIGSFVGDRCVNLTWDHPAINGGSAITGYKIYRGTVPGSELLVATLGNVTSFTNPGLVNGQPYYYRVGAVNAVGEGSLSVAISAVPRTVPGTARGLTITVGNETVRLSWLPPASNGGSAITGYRIYRGIASGSEVLVETIANVTSFVDTGLVNGQRYYYTVCAENLAGLGVPSSEVTAMPLEGNTSEGDLPLIIIEIVAVILATLGILILGRSHFSKSMKSIIRKRRYGRLRKRLAASLRYGIKDQGDNNQQAKRTTTPFDANQPKRSIRKVTAATPPARSAIPDSPRRALADAIPPQDDKKPKYVRKKVTAASLPPKSAIPDSPRRTLDDSITLPKDNTLNEVEKTITPPVPPRPLNLSDMPRPTVVDLPRPTLREDLTPPDFKSPKRFGKKGTAVVGSPQLSIPDSPRRTLDKVAARKSDLVPEKLVGWNIGAEAKARDEANPAWFTAGAENHSTGEAPASDRTGGDEPRKVSTAEQDNPPTSLDGTGRRKNGDAGDPSL
jgi:fibronectin type 3 domain-containing protein